MIRQNDQRDAILQQNIDNLGNRPVTIPVSANLEFGTYATNRFEFYQVDGITPSLVPVTGGKVKISGVSNGYANALNTQIGNVLADTLNVRVLIFKQESVALLFSVIDINTPVVAGDGFQYNVVNGAHNGANFTSGDKAVLFLESLTVDALQDVSLGAVTDNDILKYNSTTKVFENVAIGTLLPTKAHSKFTSTYVADLSAGAVGSWLPKVTNAEFTYAEVLDNNGLFSLQATAGQRIKYDGTATATFKVTVNLEAFATGAGENDRVIEYGVSLNGLDPVESVKHYSKNSILSAEGTAIINDLVTLNNSDTLDIIQRVVEATVTAIKYYKVSILLQEV